ncbi:methyltransferase [Pelagibius litoralis]|uniref:Methyltransferase n=2 Tax=Pelagibius litoralis TaxID=374515 RepID=A0A967EZE9_9PROT|nr:methyltransferase [Pelagibius litoralis]
MTEDSLLDGKVQLRQPAEGYRAAIDPVLLAAATPAVAGDVVADLGCGVASASLCLLHRIPEVRLVGLELQPLLGKLGQENAQLNAVEDRLSVHIGDVRAPPASVAAAGFDHVMMNPPYLDPAAARLSQHEVRRIATVEGEAGLAAWMNCALGLLRPRGSLTLIHRADRLDEILARLSGDCGHLTVLPLWPRLGQPAKRIIVQARKGTGAPLRLLPGLALHDESGTYSAAAEAVLRKAEALPL